MNIKDFNKLIGRKVRFYISISIFVGFGWFILESSFIFIFQALLSKIGLIDPGSIASQNYFHKFSLNQLIFIVSLFGLFRFLLLFSKLYIANLAQQKFLRLQRTRIVEGGIRFASLMSSGETIAIFSEVVSMASGFVYQVPLLLLTSISSGMFLIYGLYLAPKEMLVSVLLLSVLLIPIKWANRRIIVAGEGVMGEWKEVNNKLIQGIKNNFLLKIYGLVNEETNKSVSNLQNLESHFNRYYKYSSFLTSIPLFIGVMVVSVILYLSTTFFKTPGTLLVSFLYILIRLAQSASEASTSFSTLRMNLISIKQLLAWNEKIQHAHEIESKNKIQYIRIKEDEDFGLKVDNIGFSYTNEILVIENFSIELKRGDIFLIKGPSGSGKSTLLSIIVGLLYPQKGKVKTNQVDAYIDLSQVGYVGPEPYLIPGSVRENLSFGSEVQFEESELWRALGATDLESEFRKHDDGLNYLLNEFTNLSTGQKQRLSFARAMLRKPKILVLDEATANLDEANESRIIERILPETKSMITVIVSHKDSFDHIATKKFVFK